MLVTENWTVHCRRLTSSFLHAEKRRGEGRRDDSVSLGRLLAWGHCILSNGEYTLNDILFAGRTTDSRRHA